MSAVIVCEDAQSDSKSPDTGRKKVVEDHSGTALEALMTSRQMGASSLPVTKAISGV
jgi:hypothetical protein